MLHFLRLFLLKCKIGSGARPHWWSYICSESTCFCFSNCSTSRHETSWHTLSQSIRPHSGGAFRTFPQPSPSLSSWLAFTLFHRQLNIHKSTCSKRSALMLPFFWAVVHSCFLGNAYGIFSHLFPQRNFNRFSHLLLKRMTGLPTVVNMFYIKTQQY